MITTSKFGEVFMITGLRIALGWIFLWASIHHYGNENYVGFFLAQTKTFHNVFAHFDSPAITPYLSFSVEYGQIAIGLSLILGCFFRVGASFGIALLIIYWMADMEFPYINSVDNFIVDEHVIFVLALGLLIFRQAGQIWGVDSYLSRLYSIKRSALLCWCTA